MIKLGELLAAVRERTDCELVGDPEATVTGVADVSVDDAGGALVPLFDARATPPPGAGALLVGQALHENENENENENRSAGRAGGRVTAKPARPQDGRQDGGHNESENENEDDGELPRLVASRPRLALGAILERLEAAPPAERRVRGGVHPSAGVASSASVHPSARIGPFAAVGAGVRVGAGAMIGAHAAVGDGAVLADGAVVAAHATVGHGTSIGARARVGAGARVDSATTIGPDSAIGSNAVLGEGCSFGEGARVGPNATIADGTTAGDRVRIGAGAAIGGDGFSYDTAAPSILEGGTDVLPWHRIPSAGTVVLEDDVEIGAGACVDRGTLGATRIGRGTKIDNLVQVAHNDRIGEHCLLTAQVGLAGSVEVGDGAIFAGQSGVKDHTTVGSRAVVMAKSAVFRDLEDGAVVFGAPARDRDDAYRRHAAVGRIDDLRRRVRALETGAREGSDEG